MLRLVVNNAGDIEKAPCQCGSVEFVPFGRGCYCKSCKRYVPADIEPKQVRADLQENLKSLNTLHARLKHMLKELEDLVK